MRDAFVCQCVLRLRIEDGLTGVGPIPSTNLFLSQSTLACGAEASRGGQEASRILIVSSTQSFQSENPEQSQRPLLPMNILVVE